eukprot:574945-Amorphochlora_amoeboformis.AAC.2
MIVFIPVGRVGGLHGLWERIARGPPWRLRDRVGCGIIKSECAILVIIIKARAKALLRDHRTWGVDIIRADFLTIGKVEKRKRRQSWSIEPKVPEIFSAFRTPNVVLHGVLTALKMQSILQEEVKKLQEVQKKIQKLSAPRGAYLTQLTENEAVLAELKLLSEDDKVYKLMGPVLVLQELETSKSQVQNRISFFKKNL